MLSPPCMPMMEEKEENGADVAEECCFPASFSGGVVLQHFW